MKKYIPNFTLLVLFAATTFAQNETALQQAFEGKTVVVKIDMPGTHQGVDLYPNRDRMMDFDSYSRRIKQFGAALRNGDSVLITKIRVKEKNIEFQLGGGGYGTAGDDTNTAITPTTVPKSRYEKDLEERIKNETDARRKRELQEDLSRERRQRERENERNRIAAEAASELKKERIEIKRLESGSRFNIWFEPRMPISGVTPRQLIELLGEYVDFGSSRDVQSPRTGMNAENNGPIREDAILSLRKGMTHLDVIALFGPPRRKAEKGDGDTKILILMYQIGEREIQIEMMSDVVIRYVISSR